MTPPETPRPAGRGRPHASSQETLAEAACELFLEQGFAATTVADITSRAGVSRSSFFNYFSSKSAVLWGEVDERIAALDAVAAAAPDAASLRDGVRSAFSGLAPDALAVAIVHAEPMGVEDDLARESALRAGAIARVCAAALVRLGTDRLAADVVAGAWAGAVLAALGAWARAGTGRSSLAVYLDRALAITADR